MKRFLITLIAAVLTSMSFGQVYELDLVDGMTINTCSGTFLDSETWDLVPGSGDLYYDIDEDYEVTFCSSIPGNAIQMDFSFLQIATGEDTLWAYDGPSTASPLIAVYNGGYLAQTVIGFSGCLTFAFKSVGPSVSAGWEGTISCFFVPPVPLQPGCTNVDFESGNFGGWYGTYGDTVMISPPPTPTAIQTGPPGSLYPTYYPSVYGSTASPQFSITSGAGVDPYGGFPVVSPNGGSFSARLGDGDLPYWGGASLEQKFTVTAANAAMIYSYAVVIQDASVGGQPHLPQEQPFFLIEAFDCVGNSIACGDFLVVGGPGIPGFTLAPGTADVYYKAWTDVFLDLSPFIGSCVTVKFTQGDCSLGAHYSYVYLDAVCGPLEITGNQWICPGESTTLYAPPGGASYAWLPGGQTTDSIVVSPAALTNYSCTITSVVGPTCTSNATYWVDVYPAADVVVNSEVICEGEIATLTAVPNSVGGTFVWTPGGLGTPSINVSPLINTNYTVTFTDANGCIDDAISTVTVNPSPIPDISGILGYCQGLSTTLGTTVPQPNYTWSTGALTPTTAATIADNPVWVSVTNAFGCVGADTVNVVENFDIIYDVDVEICIGETAIIHGNVESVPGIYTQTYVLPTGCDSTLNVTLIVHPLPIIDAGIDQSECEGIGVILNAVGAPTINWDLPGVTNGVAFNPPVGTTTYTATGIDINGCENTDQVDVTISPAPDVNPILDQAVCVNDQVSAVNITGNFPGTTFDWVNSNPSIGLLGAGSGSILAFTGSNLGGAPISGTITVTPFLNGCYGPDEVFTITVNPLPIVSAGPDILVCEGDQLTLNGAGATVYVWDNSVLDGVPFLPSAITYTVTGVDANGCSNTDEMVVSIESFIPAFTSTIPTCAPFDVTFTNTTPGAFTNCVWTFSNGHIINGCGPVSYTFPSSGIYDVTLTLTSATGCTNSTTILGMVNISPEPLASFTPFQLDITTLNTEVEFTNTSLNADSYEWNFGDGSPISNEVNPTHTFPTGNGAIYTVMLVALTDQGCNDTIYGTVAVEEELLFYVPNTFTPDDDEFNQQFKPIFSSGHDPSDFEMLIFNRWGELIWESHNLEVGWDGTYRGKLCQDGTYTWKLIFKLVNTDEKRTVVGHVNIIR